MPLGHLTGNLQQAQADDLQPLAFQPGQDLADQPTLDAIGLDQDQGTLHAIWLSCGVWTDGVARTESRPVCVVEVAQVRAARS